MSAPGAGACARAREVSSNPPLAAWYTIGVLSIAYTMSFLDRQILVLLVDPIRHDLALTDTGVSLLTGLSFAIVYAAMGVPMGRAADMWSRKKVITLGVALWGLMTVVCGCARSFAQLFIGRMGVGIGEAALTPVAYSMVPDLFPPDRQARAMSIFVLGAFIGSGLSLVFGGWVIGAFSGIKAVTLPFMGTLHTWQLAIGSVGLATLLTLIPLSRIREPRSRHVVTHEGDPVHRRFPDVLRYLWQARRSYVSIFIGVPLTNTFAYGMLAWMPTFFIRDHGWSPSHVGTILGTLGMVGGVAGGLTGGWLADRWRRLGVIDATIRATAYAVILTIPLPAAVVFAPCVPATLIAMAALSFMVAFIVPLVPTGLQNITPRHMRAQVSALFLLVVNLVGIGCGPTLIALTTDYLFHNDRSVGSSIVLIGIIANSASGLILFAGLRGFRTAARAADALSSA